MPLEEELILAYLKVINFLLNLNIKIGKRLAFYQAKYSTKDEINSLMNKKKFDLRTLSTNLKKLIIYDQSIIDNRMDICRGCEFYFKATGQCTICKCIAKLKTRISVEVCPKQKWKAVKI